MADAFGDAIGLDDAKESWCGAKSMELEFCCDFIFRVRVDVRASEVVSDRERRTGREFESEKLKIETGCEFRLLVLSAPQSGCSDSDQATLNPLRPTRESPRKSGAKEEFCVRG